MTGLLQNQGEGAEELEEGEGEIPPFFLGGGLTAEQNSGVKLQYWSSNYLRGGRMNGTLFKRPNEPL